MEKAYYPKMPSETSLVGNCSGNPSIMFAQELGGFKSILFFTSWKWSCQLNLRHVESCTFSLHHFYGTSHLNSTNSCLVTHWLDTVWTSMSSSFETVWFVAVNLDWNSSSSRFISMKFWWPLIVVQFDTVWTLVSPWLKLVQTLHVTMVYHCQATGLDCQNLCAAFGQHCHKLFTSPCLWPYQY